ncbi:cell morphogenesis protein PAG1 [Podospora australis]|uniref:Cell morphogenesis protein PAG1 n=1 Tax=Podospora australis TaxID=1536484 RepID=A0AAN7APK2_9PEZI|nr:cell morphogenesis protein PAG1 [Podospora australis]
MEAGLKDDGVMLTTRIAPSQTTTTLPDHEPLKFSPRAVTRLDEEDEDWQRTIRPAALVDPKRSVAHSRESSIDKLQRPDPTRAHTAHAPPSRSALGGVIERVVDPKAASYGHHRQTSIVHGIGIHHSRNGSLASSASSPLSPQMIAAAGAGLTPERVEMQIHGFSRMDNEGGLGTRPGTAMSGTTVTSGGANIPERTSSVTADTGIHIPARGKLERMHSGSGKSRRDHSHHSSHSSSRHHKEDQQKTVGEYALHVLFTSFIAQAEEKLNDCITTPFEPEPYVERICGPGADPAFDQLIVALGHIAKQKPKPLIDSMMLWRKSKSDAAAEARTQLQQLRITPPPPALLQRRNTEPQPLVPPAGTAASETVGGGAQSEFAAKQEFVTHAERRSTVSIFVLCRVLLEVLTQSTLASITPEMEEKLESIIFGQLKISDTEQLMISPLKLANWNLFAQLLGAMGEINFTSVTDRFIVDLNHSLIELAAKNPSTPSRDVESRMELVLGGMKHLRIRTSPEAAWDQSCEFMAALGKLFSRSHGVKVKAAFCQVLEMLMLPIAAEATNEDLAHPKWGEVLSTVGPRLAQMIVKPRHWPYAFPLTATMLCVSPPDTFISQWQQLVYPLPPKLKDRYTRPICMQVVSRLVWTYLYRTSESASGTTKKLDEVMKTVLPNPKRPYSATDHAVIEPLIQIIRFIGYKHPEYCFRTIIFPLINADLFTSNRELKIEQLDPDRMVVGIRAFLIVMADLEKDEKGRPPFPQTYAPSVAPEKAPPTSPMVGSPRGTPSVASATLSAGERLSRPVVVSSLTDSVRDYYARFCEILGKITIICDNTFGGQAALDEKFEKFSSPGPKTPMADTFNFSRRDDHPNPQEQKQAFYELLHVAVQALPRCLSPDIPFNTLINLLCTGTAHVQSNIAESSAKSLKAIARQSHAHQVTMGFARFIFNFDDRYSTMSDGGMLGPGHIEKTLMLYIELLRIWIEEIKQKTKDASSDSTEPGGADKRGIKLDLSSVWAEVDQVEAHGLFFLCSQSRRVRYYAVSVLRLITEFDAVLRKPTVAREKDTPRLIDILENDSIQVMSFNDEQLSVAERSRLQRGMQSNSQGALIELCTSDMSYDTTLWFKIFPNFIRIAFDKCPFTITLSRDLICERILQLYKVITVLSEPSRGPYYADSSSARLTAKTPTSQQEGVIEQWKLYLVFACTTLADPGSAQGNGTSNGQHGRKGSKSTTAAEKIGSARTLFKYLNPMLSVSSAPIREAVVIAMGSINIHIYRTLLEELQGHVSRCNDDARQRLHQRTNSSPRRNRKMDILRTEITHVYKLTSHFLKEPEVYQDDWILSNLVGYAKDLKIFLMDGEVQMDWEFQKLRRHYCGLVEELFEGINRTKDASRWMTFEARKSAFALMEDWCGFSPNQPQIRVREDNMRQSVIDQKAVGERGTFTAAMEIEKRNLRTAALSAMAALCGGPISVTTETTTLQFDIRRMLAWIEAIFNSGSDRMNVIGRRALMNIIIHNQDIFLLFEHCISRCYLAEAPKMLESYFTVVTEVILENPDNACPFWKLVGLCLFMLGNDQSGIRSKAAHLLRTLEERQLQLKSSKIQDFDISISDKTKAVYKLAQFEISKRLAKQHTELAFHIFSEFTLYFKEQQPASQRNVVAVILPWIQSVELKVDPNGGPIAQSYVLLANLLELTIKSSAALHNEVQALWQALATGPHPGNVRLILDFIMSLCLERREQNFVEYAKQIVVFLASTNSTPGNKVVEFLLLQITPKAMVPNEKREAVPPPPDIEKLPYYAELATVLPVGTKQAGFSLGQLSLILLVDLMVAPVSLNADSVPVLLQVVTVLWDHYTPLVQEQAREMLVHLIHELVISKLDDENTPLATRKNIETLIDAIRNHDRSVVWGYEDSNGKMDTHDNKVPPNMEYLTAEVVKTFELTFPGIKDQWGRLSLTWATSCPVRHLACRSFQIFRCILTSLDQYMLGDMLARLSNTIADEDLEIQTFSMEILTTLKTLIVKLDGDKLLALPQLFWTTCACLESINECEFLEAVEMLNEFLDKLDFGSPNVRRLLYDGQPSKWDGPFEGLQPLLYKGLRSSTCFELTLSTLERLIRLPSDALIGDDNRLFFTIIANFPRFLYAMDQKSEDSAVAQTASALMTAAYERDLRSIALVLDKYLAKVYSSGDDFISQLFAALQEHFLPVLDFRMVAMLMGFLTNGTSWVKIRTMRILRVIIPEVEMRKPEIASHGSDMISPLLRLLQTEYCMEALEVLDSIMTMSGSSMDKHHLRMSMMRPTSKTVRKEYERTQSLFGIPEPSGWAIPMPAKKTDSTRANIHAAFYMCQSVGGVVAEPTPTPEVEFHTDEFPYGYFPGSDRADTMMSDDIRDNPPMGDLVSKLDSLDDFFDDLSTSPPSDGRSSRTITEFSPDTFESDAQLYDEQILPILHQASTNTGNMSFQNGFADRPTFIPREGPANMMNPGAFNVIAGNGNNPNSSPAGAGGVTPPNRPGLHARSITSPSAPASYNPQLSEFTDDEFMEDVFSDGDDERPNTANGEGGSFFLENMIRPLAQSTRSRMRRMTGSRSREEKFLFQQHHLHQYPPGSPQSMVAQVPKVPNAFLTQQAQAQGQQLQSHMQGPRSDVL